MTIPFSSTPGVSFVDFSQMDKNGWNAAMEEALASFRQAIANAGHPVEPATFDNTLGVLEHGNLIVMDVFGALGCASYHSTEEMQELMEIWQPRVVEQSATAMQDENLFSAIQQAFANEGENWSSSQRKLFDDTMRQFKKAGAGLDDASKSKILQLNTELASLETKFDQINLKNANVTIALPVSSLKDADPALLAECAHSLIDGQEMIAVPVSSPFADPLLTQLSDRSARHAIWKAWKGRGKGISDGDEDTSDLIATILDKRFELASLLGYGSWADYALDGQMAKTPSAVLDVLRSTWDTITPVANDDLNALQEFAQSLGADYVLEDWDVPYFATKYCAETFGVNPEEVKQFFSLERVRAKAFEAAEKVFGLSFVEDASIPTYHPDTTRYLVRQHGVDIGVLIIDDFMRATKAPGAWMNSFSSANELNNNGSGVVNVLNIPSPALGQPTLLTYDEVITIFHELGHALHGLLGRTQYPSQSGTCVARDFVELPSQMFENWASSPEALRDIAQHWSTKAPMPEDMLNRVLSAQKFGSTFRQTSYLISALVDMELHGGDRAGRDVNTWESEITDKLNGPRQLSARHQASHFSHLFSGGYAAGYYSYLWAEMLEADVFARFKEEGDIFSKPASEALSKLYQAGGSQDPMELFVAFRGRQPNPAAVVEKWGVPSKRSAPSIK